MKFWILKTFHHRVFLSGYISLKSTANPVKRIKKNSGNHKSAACFALSFHSEQIMSNSAGKSSRCLSRQTSFQWPVAKIEALLGQSCQLRFKTPHTV